MSLLTGRPYMTTDGGNDKIKKPSHACSYCIRNQIIQLKETSVCQQLGGFYEQAGRQACQGAPKQIPAAAKEQRKEKPPGNK